MDEIVYHGTLERTGDYAEGDVLVRKGMNSVLVGFIDAGGHIPSLAWASYHWPREEGEEEMEGWSSPTGESGDTVTYPPVSRIYQ
jgi:hypothetical protein